MKRVVLIIGLILIFLCGFGYSAIDSFHSTNELHATISGGESLNSTTGLIQAPYYSTDSGELNVLYGAGLAVVNVKDISMSSTAHLVLTDENGKSYPTVLEMASTLHLPAESNVVMENRGDLNVKSNNPGSPNVDWHNSLQFPEDLNLTGLDMNSSLGQMTDQNLQALGMYCEDHGIGYTTSSNAHFFDSNDDLGVTCRWGEGEQIVAGN